MPLSSLPEPSLAPEQVLECLGAIALGIYQTQLLDDILNTAVQELRKLLQSDRVLIYRFQPDESGVVVAESVGSSWTPVLGQTIYDPCFTSNRAQAYGQGHFSAITDIYTREFQRCYLELLAQFQVRANLVVPIRDTTPKPKSPIQNPSCAPSTPTVQPEINNPLWGLLIAHHCSDFREWQPLEVKLLQQIAVQIAIAIGQARALEQFQTEVSQRQKVQAKLQASEQFLHSIYDGAANSIFVVDVSPTGEFRFAGLNSAHEQLSGLRSEDINGKSPEQVLSAPVAAAVCANYARCVQAGTTISYEECLSFQGEENWWLTTLTPLRDAHSRIYRLTGTSINITKRKKAEQERDQEVAAKHRLFEQIEQQNQTLETKVQQRTAQLSIANEQLQQEVVERKQAEEALRLSEEKFRQLAENIQCVFWISNFPMTQTDYISPAYEKIWGRPCAELYASPKSWIDAVHPEDRDRIRATLAKIRQDEHEKEYRIVRPDGEIRWIRDRSFPIQNETGEVYRVVGIAEDITERKQLQIKLLNSEERFRTSIENMLDCFGIYTAVRDESGQIVDFLIEYMNAAACVNHCTTKEEMVGKHLCELMPAHRTTGLFEQYCQVVETSQPLVKEFLFYEDSCQGRSIRAVFDIRAVKLGDGFACAWRDVTQRKQADDQLKAALLEKETLLKEIHHRVKNNLQVISSLLRLQSRQIQDQQTLELFKESQNRVQAMALMHEKLYQSSNLAQIDFHQYITTLVGHLCRSYDIRRQAVAFKINVEPVSLAIDTAIPCGLIINELVTNSLKYAFPDNQGGEICIRLQFGESPLSVPVDRQLLILTISDNGIGLPEYLDLTNISSLGLQLVCRLTKQIGGILELNRSQGTEFNIAFAKPSSI